MSPNLTPTNDRDERHAEMYEQVVFNTISTVGLSKHELQPRYIDSGFAFYFRYNLHANPVLNF